MAGKRRVFSLPVSMWEVRSVPSSTNEITRTIEAATPSTEPTGIPISSLPVADTPGNSDVVPGVQSGTTKKFSLANLFSWILGQLTPAGIGAVPTSRTVNNKALSQDISLGAEDVPYDPTNSGLTATNVQDAIDEVVDDLDGKQGAITAAGILKGDGQGGVSAATAGTDYQVPLTAGTDYATPAQLADKANQSQLAYVNTGTTATQNYSVGDYICWNGNLYTANQAISSGTTLSADTGGNLTAVVGGGLNSLHQKTKDFVKIATYTTDGNYPLAYSSYSEFILVFVLAGSVRLAEYVPASLFSVGPRWRITQDGNVYFDVLFNSGDTVACQVSQGNYSGSFGEIWAR